MTASDTPIDAVITWVDGSDEEHRTKRLAHKGTSSGQEETRFSSSGEIYICVASILKYAPYVRRIFIVTDNQTPSRLEEFHRNGLCDSSRIKIVDHTELFSGLLHHLPTFNSLSLEPMLWKIDDMAENFAYFNDDCFLNRKTTPQDFFVDGKPVLRGEYKSLSEFKLKSVISRLFGRELRNRPGFSFAQMHGAALAGNRLSYYRFDHYPHPMRKSTQRGFYQNNPKLLEDQVQWKFRSAGQFNPISLANHLEISTGNAILLPPPRLAYFAPGLQPLTEPDIRRLLDDNAIFGCLQSLDLFEDGGARVLAVLAEKLGEFLPFEVETIEAK